MSVTSVSRDIRPESDPYRSEDDHLLSSSLHRIDHSRSSTEKEIEEIICFYHSDEGGISFNYPLSERNYQNLLMRI